MAILSRQRKMPRYYAELKAPAGKTDPATPLPVPPVQNALTMQTSGPVEGLLESTLSPHARSQRTPSVEDT